MLIRLADLPFVQVNIHREGCSLSLPKSNGFFCSFDAPCNHLIRYLLDFSKGISFRFSIQGSPFEQKVWEALSLIPFGSTMTYGEIAKTIAQPQSARAVGGACGRNPMPLFIPCHRALANSSIGGFAFGMEIKNRLLDFEKKTNLSLNRT